jgi:uncharacterized protein
MYLEKIKNIFQEIQIPENAFPEYLDWLNTDVWDRFKLEKDFLLSALLIQISGQYPELIFKGGTCLNKCYFPYFRLSEDLDFVFIEKEWRDKRKNILEIWKKKLIEFTALFGLTWVEKRTKYNEDQQWLFEFSYISLLDESLQTIKIDISLKEKLEKKPIPKKIQSFFIDPVFSWDVFPDTEISCMDIDEIIAEKIRAALTRTAIRDYFDLYYIQLQTWRDFSELRDLVKIKLAEVDFAYHDGYDILKKQVESDLRPVLRDMMGFDFDLMWQFVHTFTSVKY